MLFEAKTDLSTTSIYQAVGQLMVQGAFENPLPKLITVLPGIPTKRTRRALDRLGISVLTYEWIDEEQTFENMGEIVSLCVKE